MRSRNLPHIRQKTFLQLFHRLFRLRVRIADSVNKSAHIVLLRHDIQTLPKVQIIGEGEETPAGTDVSASVANDTISFTNFPIKDIVLSVVGDEALADQIVEAVGDVNYKIGYEPTLTANKDSVVFVMHPESLKLSVTLPSSTEEEAQPLLVEVKVEAGNTAAYAVESGNMKFDFHAAEILLGEGEGQTSLPGFKGMSFDFDMNQSKLAHHGF